MVTLCLDLATKTGWVLKRGAPLESGVQDFAKKRGESEGMIYIRFRAWLEQFVDMVKPDLVLYEMPHARGAGTVVLMGLETRVHEVAATRGFDYQKVHSASIKKAATGSGKASKEQVKAAIKARLGREPVDDNEADAVGILIWGEANLNA